MLLKILKSQISYILFMVKNKSNLSRNFIIAVVIIIFLLIIIQTPQQVACTEEAKLCPDGSAVGRVPPNCEFAPCPSESCESASDCVGTECCHPTSCINKAYKGVCNELCTQVCQGPLDCGAGACSCVNNKCVIVPR
jgi:hypothetical protein